ncbi:MAG: hypothetical protein JOY59_01785, partial [Candidatus Eremiobacteraeota bacterium]|nr:hypothetical protein [Candidatus Eremiobacteraeota bacterium]
MGRVLRIPTPSRDDLASRLYFAIESALDLQRRIGRKTYALYQAVLLGMLDRDALNAITGLCYAAKAPRWSEDAYLRSGLMAWEELALATEFRDCRSILVASAGGGREMLALAQRGLAVTGFDCAPNLVESSRALLASHGVSATIVAAAPDECPPVGPHDGAIVGWCGYMHILGRDARIRFLRGLRAQLPVGGPLLVSSLTRPERHRELELIARLANVLRRLRRRPPVEVGDEVRWHYHHRFAPSEIAAELEAAGFSMGRFSL